MNDFLARVGDSLAAKIAHEGLGPVSSGTVRHWVAVQDEDGMTIGEDDDTGLEPHEILGTLIARRGVSGAAYVTQHDADALVAQAYVDYPEYGLNSDIRRSRIQRTGGGIEVGTWAYTV
jgi:hypothetical protein